MLAPFTVENASLAGTTYYGMGGEARYLSSPRSLSEVRAVVAFARQSGLPLAVLGSGSNAVCSDAAFEGVVVRLGDLRRWHWLDARRLHCEAGVTNTEVAEACLERGVRGGHWMYRMPGLVGASIRMNARCYGGEVSQVVESVTTLDVTGALHTYSAAEVFKGYKSTSLMERPEIVVSCVFQFPDSPEKNSETTDVDITSNILADMETCERDRHSKHHFDFPSCGSTFKNNYAVGKPSGRVFDELGLKGTRVGAAAVSNFHANFIWNLGGARAVDMLSLAADMRARALAAGADLELEVQPIGLFDSALSAQCAMERLGPAYEESTQEANNQGPRSPKWGGRKWVGLTWHPGAHSVSQDPFPRELFHLFPEEYFRTPDAGLSGISIRLVQLVSVAHARANPDAPFLRWETRVRETALATLFPLSPPTKGKIGAGSVPLDDAFVNSLWTFSVSEIFFGHPNWQKMASKTKGHSEASSQVDPQAPYLEFELTPHLHWIALAFEGRRRRAPESVTPNASSWQGVERFWERVVLPAPEAPQGEPAVAFGMTFPWSVLAPCIGPSAHLTQGGAVLAQAALSLGEGRFFLAPHWSRLGDAETHCQEHLQAHAPDFHQPTRYELFALE